ncbi:MAG: hypothetical protein HY716_17235 [Planctomycetes bacterium]|nr:hypothetical protein [Planctomycetota bacterium]
MRSQFIAAIVLLASAVQDKAQEKKLPTSIYLAGPEGASDGDLELTRKALQERCNTYGYVGTIAKLLKKGKQRRIELILKDGFTRMMIQKVADFASTMANSVEIRTSYMWKSDAERDRYEYYNDDSPDGTVRWTDDRSVRRLTYKKPIFSGPDLCGPKKVKARYCFELTDAGLSKLKKLQDSGIVENFERDYRSALMLVDNLWVTNCELKVIKSDDSDKRIVGVQYIDNGSLELSSYDLMLQNPMPFPMKIVAYR